MDTKPKRKGEISPVQAARLVGRARNTLYNWCRWSCSGSQPSPLDGIVRRDVTGHYWIDRHSLLVGDE